MQLAAAPVLGGRAVNDDNINNGAHVRWTAAATLRAQATRWLRDGQGGPVAPTSKVTVQTVQEAF